MLQSSDRSGWRDTLSVGFVTVYLLAVGCLLVLARRIPTPPFLRIVWSRLLPPYAGTVKKIQPSAGHCFSAPMSSRLLTDLESSSSLQLFEDGRALGPAHTPHDQICAIGAGRYLHWGRLLYFSTSDNTDPRSNGRCYTVKQAHEPAVTAAKHS